MSLQRMRLRLQHVMAAAEDEARASFLVEEQQHGEPSSWTVQADATRSFVRQVGRSEGREGGRGEEVHPSIHPWPLIGVCRKPWPGSDTWGMICVCGGVGGARGHHGARDCAGELAAE